MRCFSMMAAAASALFLLAVAASAQTGTQAGPGSRAGGIQNQRGQAMQDGDHGGKRPPPTESTEAYKAAADQTHIDMAVPYTGRADEDFAAVMAAHHKGAIAMAQVQLKYGTDPELRTLAQHVIAENEKEIAVLKAWQAKHK